MQKITDQLIDELHSEFGALPTLPRARTLYETIETLAPDILALRERNYAWDAIAELLRGKRIQITASTLRSYHTRATSRAEEAATKFQPRAAAPLRPQRQRPPHVAKTVTIQRAASSAAPENAGSWERGTGRAEPDAAAHTGAESAALTSQTAEPTLVDTVSRLPGYFHAREDSEAL